MATPRGVTLALFTDSTTHMRTIWLSRSKIVLTFLALTILIGFTAYSASWILAQRYINSAMSDVLQENRALQENINGLGERLVEIDHQLGQIAVSDDQLRVLADIPKIDQDIREVGIGGILMQGIGLDDEDELVQELIFDLDKIEREIRLQRQSFLEINRQFKEKTELLSHTPSIRPVEGGYISSTFGRRRDPFTRRWTHHNGVDFSHERGAPIFAAADGVIVHAKRAHGLGKVIIIDHEYGFNTVYGHLSIFTVSNGATVKRGDKIGEVGNTGRSTAPHLHYEVHVDGKAVEPLDYYFEGMADFSQRRY